MFVTLSFWLPHDSSHKNPKVDLKVDVGYLHDRSYTSLVQIAATETLSTDLCYWGDRRLLHANVKPTGACIS